jgi:transcriptional regulator GlxA family with amidase domain
VPQPSNNKKVGTPKWRKALDYISCFEHDILGLFQANVVTGGTVAMSPRNFARLFHQEVGETPGKHVEHLRLEAARRLLQSRSTNLSEVARASGFGSAEALPRVFLRRLGVTPRHYRQSFGRAAG